MISLTRLISFTTLNTVVGSVLLTWAGALTVLAAAPQETVRIAFHSFSKEVMDPAQDSGPGLVYHGQLFDNFIGATVEGKLTTAYGVLEGHESNADATSWTFVLKKGIQWHDGMEMTADDLKFSIDHYAEPTTQCGQCGAVRANLDRVEVVDRSTVRLYLKQADTGIPMVFGPLEGNFMVLPKHYYEKVGAAGFENAPLGSGPWKFVKREIGQYIEYEANPRYWNPARVPGFAKLRMMLVPESRTRVAIGGSTWAYRHPEKAKRLFTEVSAIIDVDARDRRLRQGNRELYEEYWAMPIVLRHTPFAASPKIADWQPSNGSPTALAFETLQPTPTK